MAENETIFHFKNILKTKAALSCIHVIQSETCWIVVTSPQNVVLQNKWNIPSKQWLGMKQGQLSWLIKADKNVLTCDANYVFH